jgi:hypothetical protein
MPSSLRPLVEVGKRSDYEVTATVLTASFAATQIEVQ